MIPVEVGLATIQEEWLLVEHLSSPQPVEELRSSRGIWISLVAVHDLVIVPLTWFCPGIDDVVETLRASLRWRKVEHVLDGQFVSVEERR